MTALTIASSAPLTAQQSLKAEIEALNKAMVDAFLKDPASVAKYYTDDARILGGGSRSIGRAAIDEYWRGATMFADWKLEVLEVGGDKHSPWQHGRSTIVSKSGRTMITEFVGILKRQPDGQLRFYIDMYVGAGPPG